MKGEDSLEMLNGIDEKYIAAAERSNKTRRALSIALPVAACLCIAAGIVFGSLKDKASSGSDQVSAIKEPEITLTKPAATDEIEAVEQKDRYITLSPEPYSFSSGDDEPGWCIKYVMFIYHGRIYYRYNTFSQFSEFFGEKVATVKPFDFDVFSDHEEGEQGSDKTDPPVIKASDYELCGTSVGNIYTVKGYDPEDVLCMRGMNGAVDVYICDNGFTDSSPDKLFEGVFRLSEKAAAVRYFSKDHEYYELGSEEYGDAISGLIEALNGAEWINDLYSEESDFFDYSHYAEMTSQFLCIPLDNGFSLAVYVYDKGFISFPNMFSSRLLKYDKSKLEPLFALMSDQKGKDLGNTHPGDFYTEEVLKADKRFGAYVPKSIPDGYSYRSLYAEYDVDWETGRIRGTNWMRIIYHTEYQGRSIYMTIMPLDILDSEAGELYRLGGEAVQLKDCTIDDIIRYVGKPKEDDDIVSYAAVISGDTAIYFWAPDSEPDAVYDLIKAIG